MVMITHTRMYIYIYMKTKAWGRYWRENVIGREYRDTHTHTPTYIYENKGMGKVLERKCNGKRVSKKSLFT